ncbi:aminotransferase class I/II-fold pyridoxal phosphate-dependent enzyme [Anaerotalea alkaliphila]|uniref:Decarboxylase n=1 Tax=Anaerotalea alkaliphila TaxID=2662126 RepID=A0A7X5HWG6_9FIRM|nr:beta-eliminating lyase-related protein [Anaerotalea alkaliphila]NDL67736.1 decarboxylase [Anaerotalea alkaliphila]
MEELLFDRLQAYAREVYPMHMPGHKMGRISWMEDMHALDATEVPGLDHLLHEEGILGEAQRRVARICGADRTFFLVNGSTVGMLAALSASTRPGGEVLLARNCHQAVFNGAFLHRCIVHWCYPEQMDGLGIHGGILPEAVDKILREKPGIETVVVTSPTYEGVVSDIRGIARVVHGHGKVLVVDEAHGAHFVFGHGAPPSAISQGADLVVQSLHKTLPFFTQTALLHACGHRVDVDLVSRYLGIYQTSSPSYVFMAQMEKGMVRLDREKERFQEYAGHLERLRSGIEALEFGTLLGKRHQGFHGIQAVDLGKICLFTHAHLPNGAVLERFLRNQGVQLEMAGLGHVVAITSVADSREGFALLLQGLEKAKEFFKNSRGCAIMETGISGKEPFKQPVSTAPLTLFEAGTAPKRMCGLLEAEGSVSAAMVHVYPPGIPLLVPGERVEKKAIAILQECLESGLHVVGLEDGLLPVVAI